MSSFLDQLRLILWRNFVRIPSQLSSDWIARFLIFATSLTFQLIKKRAKRDTLLEIAFPLIFFSVLAALKSSVPSQYKDADLQPDVYSLSNYPLSQFLLADGCLLYTPTDACTFIFHLLHVAFLLFPFRI